MKIAFLNYYQKINQRGAETFVSELSRRLGRTYSTKIFSAPSRTTIPSTDHQLSLFRRLYLDPLSLRVGFWTITRLGRISRYQADIVFALNGGWQTLILRLYTWLTGKKLVVAGQSGPGWDDRVNLLFAPDLFVCLTKTQLRWAKKAFHFPQQKFILIPNGVDLDRFSSQTKKAAVDLQKPVIITVAASTPAKRVLQTIKAVARLKKASLLLLGQGPLDDQINALGQQLLGPSRFLHTSVKHTQTPAYYQAADLFTLCSQSSEAFGIVYLEALASNLPVVATKDASRREIVGNAGLFVANPDNPRQYATQLEIALSKKWRDLPRKQAQNFSWDLIAKRYEKVLTSL